MYNSDDLQGPLYIIYEDFFIIAKETENVSRQASSYVEQSSIWMSPLFQKSLIPP